MRLLDMIYLAFAALRSRKLRTTLTILGMTIGPALYVAAIASTQGYGEALTSGLQSLGANVIQLMSMPRGGPRGGGSIELTEKVIQELSKIEGVTAVAPVYSIPRATIKIKGVTVESSPEEQTYMIIAVDLNLLDKIFQGLRLEEGELSRAGSSIAVIGARVAKPDSSDLPEVNLGDTITIETTTSGGERRMITVRVVGILKQYGQGLFFNPDTTIFIPLRAGSRLTASSTYNQVLIIAKDTSYIEQIQREIANVLGSNVRTFSPQQMAQTIEQTIGQFSSFLASMSFMSFIVAFLAIMTTMFTSVTERIREIGILKAIGFKTKHILGLFLMEAMLIGFIGGIIGVVSGIIGAHFFSMPLGNIRAALGQPGGGRAVTSFSFEMTPKVTPDLLLTALAMAIMIGLLAGLLPAWRAAKYTPVEALRYE
ncbi:MAG: ABC transporter permease [Candidatus Parvarchaeota archaeon]